MQSVGTIKVLQLLPTFHQTFIKRFYSGHVQVIGLTQPAPTVV